MKIEKIKEEMLAFRDFYGGDLLNRSDVESATSKEELAQIIDRHRTHMEDMANDACGSLDRFKRKLGLD